MIVQDADARGSAIRGSRLFDADWYGWRHDLSGYDVDALLAHYLTEGAASGFAPSPLFDPHFYAESAGVPIDTALSHYLAVGYRLLLSPHRLFDVSYYVAQRDDLRQDHVEPLSHYLSYGADEGLNPNVMFDTRWYLDEYPSVAGQINPLQHYVQFGEAMGLRPSSRFDPVYYLANSPDVRDGGWSALAHYLSYGRREGRSPIDQPTVIEKRPRTVPRSDDKMASISVVIPTYNRAALLDETLRLLVDNAEGLDVEFIVIDDGSSDGTPAVLERHGLETPNLTTRRVPNGGPGQARNLGASLATKDVILFLGDDIQPLDREFFRTHGRLHAEYAGDQFGVLGKCVWPSSRGHDVSFVMAHIQGKGGEQFGYSDLTPYSFIDWRFFYTANVSVKRGVVSDWISEGFKSEFTLAAYEDGELAYRLAQRPQGFSIYYDPTSVGRHIHPYCAETFINRQVNAGMMAKVFLDLHGIADTLGVDRLLVALNSEERGGDAALVSEYLAIIEGIKAWARMLDRQGVLGREHWHDDLLYAVFTLAYHQGFVFAAASGASNLAAAYRLMIGDFVSRMRAVIHHEVSPHDFILHGLGLSA